MQRLLKNFVPAADEVVRLMKGKDAECRLAQKIFEQGHYKGRRGTTRQGIYATTPDGELLASGNPNQAEGMKALLSDALAKWQALAPRGGSQTDTAALAATQLDRYERRYPADGLVLRCFSRDLPRESLPEDWRAHAWNQDYAWFTRDEAAMLLPEPTLGAQREVPDSLLRRLARFHFLDNVRGQTYTYADRDIKAISLRSHAVSITSQTIKLRLEGESICTASGVWPVAGDRDARSPKRQQRGMNLRLLGHAAYDRQSGRFTEFEMVALGTRHGGTQYNGRMDDLGHAGIGFYLTLGDGSPTQRVAPAHFYVYGWR